MQKDRLSLRRASGELKIEVGRIHQEEADRFEQTEPEDIQFGHFENGLDVMAVGDVVPKMLQRREEAQKISVPGISVVPDWMFLKMNPTMVRSARSKMWYSPRIYQP